MDVNYITEARPNPGGSDATCPTCGALLSCLSCGDVLTEYDAAILSLLKDEPMPNGEWPHLAICSGSRHAKPGVRGHSCCCKPVGHQELLKAEARVPELEKALRTMHLVYCRTYCGSNDHTADCRRTRALLDR